MSSGMPIVRRGVCVPNPSHLDELSFNNSLDFSITNLYFPIRLGVVWRGDVVMYSVFLQQCPEVWVVELWAAVADDVMENYFTKIWIQGF